MYKLFVNWRLNFTIYWLFNFTNFCGCKVTDYILLSFLIALLISGCANNQTDSNSHKDAEDSLNNDTITNDRFCYLPDTLIMDRQLFLFASKLTEIEQIYNDSIADSNIYQSWFREADSLFRADLDNRHVGIDLCLYHISDNMIPDIKEYGNKCTAANGEAAWLNLGVLLYKMFSEQQNILQDSTEECSLLWKSENDSWLRFISKLFPLIDYEIGNVTGSSAAYEVPITFSKIIQSRIDGLAESANKPTQLETNNIESLKRLEGAISSINTLHLDWDKDELVEDSLQNENKIGAINALNDWIFTRNKLSQYMKRPTDYRYVTYSTIDSISNIIYKLRY